MKLGRSLNDLAAEITRQNATKRDFVEPTQMLSVVPKGDDVILRVNRAKEDDQDYPINDLAHDQIAAHTKIPKVYYDKCRKEAPDLLANNIETWFKKFPAVRMVRTLDHKARAFLSDKFARLDNFDFANAILPVLLKRKLHIMSCEVTEKRLYIKAVDEQLFRDVPVGYKFGDGSHRIYETCAPMICASNSEVGFGMLALDTGVYTKACTNTALFTDGGSFRRRHLGGRHKILENLGGDIDSLMTEETKKKTNEVLWLQLRDVMLATFDKDKLTERVAKIAATAENRIENKVPELMELTAEKFGLNETEKDSVLKYLMEGGNPNQYGLHAAVTRAAQDADSYDRATEMEYMGGKIVNLSKDEWKQLASA